MGATLAPLTLKVLYHDNVDIGVTVTKYLSSTSDLEAMVWEFITTFILMFTICGVATDHRGVSYNLPWIVLAIASLIFLFLSHNYCIVYCEMVSELKVSYKIKNNQVE